MLQLHAGRKISASLQHFHRPGNKLVTREVTGLWPTPIYQHSFYFNPLAKIQSKILWEKRNLVLVVSSLVWTKNLCCKFSASLLLRWLNLTNPFFRNGNQHLQETSHLQTGWAVICFCSVPPGRSFPSFTLRVSADTNKHVEGSGVIQSAKFPAAQPPDPNQPSKIETEYWPCPPSLAAMGNTHRHRIGSTSIWTVKLNIDKWGSYSVLLQILLTTAQHFCGCFVHLLCEAPSNELLSIWLNVSR